MQINGSWYNELGSKMEIAVAVDGTITGMYQTAVGNAKGIYPLAGRTEVDSPNDDQNIGFVVSWWNEYGNSHSVTTWSGQVQEIDGQQIMRTTWLLTSETDPKDDWASTLVSIDVFTRERPSAEVVAHAKRFGKSPYPKALT